MLGALSRLVVHLASWLVPRHERGDWRLEWSSEIYHHRMDLASAHRLDWRAELNLLRRSFGAFADALDLRGSASLREGLGADVRFGIRMLRKSPGFTVVAVVLLALGIGATTAIFSVVHAVLLEPLPFREPEELVVVWEHAYKSGNERNVVSPHNFLRWRERARSFEALSSLTPWAANVTGDAQAERVAIGYVSADFFQTLGIAAAVGRVLAPEDGTPGHGNVAVIGNGLWQRRYGGVEDVLGKTVHIDGKEATIVGVLPPQIEFPSFQGGAGGALELWVPTVFTDEHREFSGRYMLVVGRLAPGATVEQADAEMKQITKRLEEEKPEVDAGWSANVFPLQPELVRETRGAILLLFAAVGAVLLIACANVGNLLLTRTVARDRELSVRAALGAHRFRIVRQLLVEGLLLAALGGFAGIAVGKLILGALLAILPTEIPRFITVELDGWVLAFTLGIALATSLLFGLLPALQVSKRGLVEPLKEGGRGGGAGASRQRLKNGIVVLETALAVVLLVATGLVVRSFASLAHTSPGFDPRNLTAIRVNLAGPRYQEASSKIAFFHAAIEQVRGLSGVESAGAISWLPLGGTGSSTSFRVADKPDPPPEEARLAEVRMVDGDLFRAMRVPVLAGRSFDEHDGPDSRGVVVINESLAKEVWPGEDPLGKTVFMSWGEEREAQVVGVVGDVRLSELQTAARPTLYWAQAQLPQSFMSVIVRSRAGVSVAASQLRDAVAELDPQIPVSSVEAMESVVARELGRPRLTLSLMSAFGVVALLLAAVGLYGVISFGVNQRAREIGIRIAIGASPGDVSRMIVEQGMKLALVGVGLGIACAVAGARAIESLLYEVDARDPMTLSLIPALLVVVAMVASYLPSRRATKIDPCAALRSE